MGSHGYTVYFTPTFGYINFSPSCYGKYTSSFTESVSWDPCIMRSSPGFVSDFSRNFTYLEDPGIEYDVNFKDVCLLHAINPQKVTLHFLKLTVRSYLPGSLHQSFKFHLQIINFQGIHHGKLTMEIHRCISY